MSNLTSSDIMKVKGQGFLRNRGTDDFSGRIVAPGSVFSAEDFENISKLSKMFGNGTAICTSRLCVEVPGIPFDKIESAQKFALEHGLLFGGTGNKIRPIAACKGSTCIFGNCDTHAIAKKIYYDFYLGWNSVTLPHKFKITVGGCPNSCMKPSINDFGIEGHKLPEFNNELCKGCKKCAIESSCPTKAAKVENGKLVIDKNKCISCGICTGKCPFKAVSHDSKTLFRIYVGGTWGKITRKGNPLSRLVTETEIFDILEKSLLWFRENAYAKERFGLTVDRIGFNEFEKAIRGDDLLNRKEIILNADIKKRD